MEDKEYIANEWLSCGPFVAPPVPVKIEDASDLQSLQFVSRKYHQTRGNWTFRKHEAYK